MPFHTPTATRAVSTRQESRRSPSTAQREAERGLRPHHLQLDPLPRLVTCPSPSRNKTSLMCSTRLCSDVWSFHSTSAQSRGSSLQSECFRPLGPWALCLTSTPREAQGSNLPSSRGASQTRCCWPPKEAVPSTARTTPLGTTLVLAIAAMLGTSEASRPPRKLQPHCLPLKTSPGPFRPKRISPRSLIVLLRQLELILHVGQLRPQISLFTSGPPPLLRVSWLRPSENSQL